MTVPSLIPSKPITLLIVDDSELVRTGLRTLLAVDDRIRVVAEAGNVTQAIALGLGEEPDVVLMDIRLPDGSGFDACRKLLEKLPGTRVIFLTSVADDKLVDEAIRSGGVGYLLKEINGRGLIDAIKNVASGRSILDSIVTQRVINLARAERERSILCASLSPQETRVLASVADGKTNKEIAVHLRLSDKTVKNYLANIFSKLNLNSRTQAAILYKTKIHPHSGRAEEPKELP